MTDLWTLDELAARAATALGEAAEQASARVREIPDSRTIRWYQTTGLVDRPAALRGRTALYGRRQLLQLVAIKRLQSQGRSLAEIQAELAGMSTDALEALVEVPFEALPARRAVDLVTVENTEIRERFWTQHHRDRIPAELAEAGAVAAPGPAAGAAAPAADAEEARPVQGVRLSDDVLLILDHPTGVLDHADIQALREAAAPLLDALVRRGLVAHQPRTKEPA